MTSKHAADQEEIVGLRCRLAAAEARVVEAEDRYQRVISVLTEAALNGPGSWPKAMVSWGPQFGDAESYVPTNEAESWHRIAATSSRLLNEMVEHAIRERNNRPASANVFSPQVVKTDDIINGRFVGVKRDCCDRCHRCGWKLSLRQEDGCIVGDCSRRPLPPLRTHCAGCGTPYEAGT